MYSSVHSHLLMFVGMAKCIWFFFLLFFFPGDELQAHYLYCVMKLIVIFVFFFMLSSYKIKPQWVGLVVKACGFQGYYPLKSRVRNFLSATFLLRPAIRTKLATQCPMLWVVRSIRPGISLVLNFRWAYMLGSQLIWGGAKYCLSGL